ncbi:hypothetical protein AB0C29_46560 [Actinoplanes sp. NPDC048791]|uniref:hypothetical protein n=1 Tax=Actinoplanes sp. NPDC048791 TaxID=3154623 RepID=UPI0033C2CDEE
MPVDVTARHRAGGIGRLLAVRTAVPRHAAEAPLADRATVEFRVPRSRRRLLWLPVVLAVLLLPAVALLTRGSGTPRAAVPLPTVSVPPPPAWTDPPAPTATRPQLRAVRQAAKLSPAPSSASPSSSPSAPAPVLLGPGADADVGPLIGSYCRATHGRFSLAVAAADTWTCARIGRAGIAVDMDALCRWRYGAAAWADLGRAGDARSWRCYRDGP